MSKCCGNCGTWKEDTVHFSDLVRVHDKTRIGDCTFEIIFPDSSYDHDQSKARMFAHDGSDCPCHTQNPEAKP